ncbi:MAG: inositol monophosphatase family protein [Chthonomonas sp.]|nr:inositol monophosphatase family protein [Chthonomonas sp.]
MSDLLTFALNAAEEAGKITLKYFRQELSIDLKSDDSPVTIADREAERYLREAISAKFPGHGFLGEEEGTTGDQSERWVIDPIDGTKSFICGVPLYGVLLSYERDGVPVVGISHFPALGETVWATKGGGAFLNGKPIQVSPVGELSHATLCSGSPTSMEDAGRMEGFMKLARQARGARTWGDAYGHCLVATGRTEAMIDPKVAYHDLSSVSLIVTEAGGRFTNFKGEEGIFHEAISCNTALFDQVVGAFA